MATRCRLVQRDIGPIRYIRARAHVQQQPNGDEVAGQCRAGQRRTVGGALGVNDVGRSVATVRCRRGLVAARRGG